MANYIALTRTNYFRVRDAHAFEAWCERRGLRFCTKGGDASRYAFSAESESGWPTFDYETDDDVDVAAELAPHLIPEDIAVLMETGGEKLRYLAGEAIAVCSTGIIAHVNLDHVYDLALKNAPNGATVSEAAY